MNDAEPISELISSAFAAVKYPGDECLRGSNEGDEPYLLEQEFKGKTDWRILEPRFLDQAPDGFGSALSFFSDEAFRFFLPAYLLADIRGQLERTNPAFHLTHGLDDSSRALPVNLRRFGERTWFENASQKFAIFTRQEAAAVVAYLIFKRESDHSERDRINQALANYWNARAA